jgi:uncharacterized phiE125 gp8 family phage protein
MPVSLARAKAHLRVDHSEDDDLITAAIAAAVNHLDGYGGILGRALMPQTWCEYGAFWPASRAIELRLAPVASIVEVKARAADGADVVLDPVFYRLLAGRASRPIVLFGIDAALPDLAKAPDALAISYAAGYPLDGDDKPTVPAALQSAILLMVGDLYRFRDSVQIGSSSAVPMSTTVDRLIAPFRRYQI